jgi:integrase
MTGRRHFGSIRKRPSGNWQATYNLDGQTHSGGTFSTKADALAFLSTIEADSRRGSWIDPRSGEVLISAYCEEWLGRRSDLAFRTRELYQFVLDRHITPSLGKFTLAGLSPSTIRGWHADIAREHPATAAKAYRLLSCIMRTAVTDGLILSTPCKIVGAGTERPKERPIATVDEIGLLANAMPERLRIVVLLAAWCQLRRGEILGLRRKDVDQGNSEIRIEQSRTFTMRGESLTKEPKTAAAFRTLAVPKNIMSEIAHHLERFTGKSSDDLLLVGASGVPVTKDSLHRSWCRARTKIGRSGLRLHDLRHTGLTLAASTGATTAELMHRAGHSSTAAAHHYQHATQARDRVLASLLERFTGSSDFNGV